jgi:hypothetical protein
MRFVAGLARGGKIVWMYQAEILERSILLISWKRNGSKLTCFWGGIWIKTEKALRMKRRGTWLHSKDHGGRLKVFFSEETVIVKFFPDQSANMAFLSDGVFKVLQRGMEGYFEIFEGWGFSLNPRSNFLFAE